MRYGDFDPEETTRPGLESEPVRRLRETDDPWETLGNVLRATALHEKQIRDGFNHLNGRLTRIERLLYGTAGTIALAVAQYLAAKLGIVIK